MITTKYMQHIYQNSNFGEDWFSYPKLYSYFCSILGDGSVMVEVGSWKGKSSAYMAVEIINSNKQIDFYCIDTWAGSMEHQADPIIKNNQLYDIFIANIELVKNYIKPIRKTSLEASTLFSNNSIDVVFIDASHEYEDVKNDIEVWYPKIKKDGIISGHDYGDWCPGVIKAVDEFRKQTDLFYKDEGCWAIRV